jgi:hypothetical protein
VESGFASDRASGGKLRSAKVESGFASDRASGGQVAISKSGIRFCGPRGRRSGDPACLLHRFGWRNEAPRQRVLAAFDPLERHRTASLKCHIL